MPGLFYDIYFWFQAWNFLTQCKENGNHKGFCFCSLMLRLLMMWYFEFFNIFEIITCCIVSLYCSKTCINGIKFNYNFQYKYSFTMKTDSIFWEGLSIKRIALYIMMVCYVKLFINLLFSSWILAVLFLSQMFRCFYFS